MFYVYQNGLMLSAATSSPCRSIAEMRSLKSEISNGAK